MDINVETLKSVVGALVLENLSLKEQLDTCQRALASLVPEAPFTPVSEPVTVPAPRRRGRRPKSAAPASTGS